MIGLKSSYAKWNFKKKKLKLKKFKKIVELEFMELEFHPKNSISIFFFFLSLIAPYSIFYKSSFTLKLDFEKIELQKRDIFLISLEKGVERWFFCTKSAFAHFLLRKYVATDYCPLVRWWVKIMLKSIKDHYSWSNNFSHMQMCYRFWPYMQNA